VIDSLENPKEMSIKDVRTKSRKIDPLPLVRKMSALAHCPWPHWTNSLFPPEYGRPLWTVPDKTVWVVTNC